MQTGRPIVPLGFAFAKSNKELSKELAQGSVLGVGSSGRGRGPGLTSGPGKVQVVALSLLLRHVWVWGVRVG